MLAFRLHVARASASDGARSLDVEALVLLTFRPAALLEPPPIGPRSGAEVLRDHRCALLPEGATAIARGKAAARLEALGCAR